MSQTFIQLADRTKLAADERTAQIAGTAHTLRRAQVTVVPSYAPDQQGVQPGELVVARLLAGAVAEAAVNGSGTAQDFTYTVATGKTLLLEAVTVVVVDAGSWVGTGFGAGGALATGLGLDVVAGASVLAALVPAAIQRTADLVSVPGARATWLGGDTLAVELDVRVEGWPVTLAAGQGVRLRVADDLTGLSSLRAAVRGRLL